MNSFLEQATAVAKPPLLDLPPVLHVLRITIEVVTPLSSSSGESVALHDNALARDANGLPILTGTTLAGVLRHLHADYFHAGGHDIGEPSHPTNLLFGLEQSGQIDGRASRIEVSFGFVHDNADRPVARRLGRAEIQNDEVLELLSRSDPVRRDNVKIDGRGVAAEHQKFERVSVPAGTRFTFELAIESDLEGIDEAKGALLQVASLLQCPYLRIGGAARRGLGRVRIAEGSRARYAMFDRSASAGWQTYARWRATQFHELDSAFAEVEVPALTADNCVRKPVSGTIRLAFEGWWRFGQGDRSILAGLAARTRNRDAEAKEPDQRPVTEPIIVYSEGKGRVVGDGSDGSFRVLAVASGLKGALAHRAEYELNRLRCRWADEVSADGSRRYRSAQELSGMLDRRGMDGLLGSIKEQGAGGAGNILIDDAWLDEIRIDPPSVADAKRRIGTLTHNSLDRFTQGVRNKILFTEESLWQGTLEFKICALTRCRRDPTNSTARPEDWVPHRLELRTAFARALEALVQGRLAVGADSGDGHGYCRPEESSVVWEDSGTWLHEPDAEQPREVRR